jgi:F420-dependent oxidoreductase-like protein
MEIGINVALGVDGPQRHGEIVAEVRAAAAAGLAAAWWPQLPPFEGVAAWDALTSLAVAGAGVPDIRLGTSVVVTHAQHPVTLARQALTAQAVVGGRLTLGIGPSHAPIVKHVYGQSFDRPLRHVREFLAVLVPSLAGEPVDVTGEAITAHAHLQVPDAPPPSLLLAALGPAMLRLAGELADGTITTWTGPRTVAEWIVPRVQEAAAGRPAPRVVVNLPVAVTDDPDGTREALAVRFGMAGQFPSYRTVLDREGVEHPAELAIVGDEEAVAKEIRRFADLGATEFVASAVGTPGDRARTLTVLADLARTSA